MGHRRNTDGVDNGTKNENDDNFFVHVHFHLEYAYSMSCLSRMAAPPGSWDLPEDFVDNFIYFEFEEKKKRTIVKDDNLHPGASCFYAYSHQDRENAEMVSAEVVHGFLNDLGKEKLKLGNSMNDLDMLRTELKKVNSDLEGLEFHEVSEHGI